MARVIQVVVNGESAAVAYPVLWEQRVVEKEVGGADVVFFWELGTASGLDARQIARSRDVGSANAFRATFDGTALTFNPTDTGFVDEQTGSTWDATGRAIAGELEGAELEPVVGIQHFWFSYSAFENDAVWEPAARR
jgi:hypothetical protein